MRVEDRSVAVIGGTGAQGRGLATRLAAAGIRVILGSRDASRAASTASVLGRSITGTGNIEAAGEGDLIIIAVPWEGHARVVSEVAEACAGKIVIDCVNPLTFDGRGPTSLAVLEGSAAEQAAALLPNSSVVAAFHHVSAVLLEDVNVGEVETDVLVLGDDREATDVVQALVDLIPGMRGVYGGRLRNSQQVEALTANLISINRRYGAHAGIRITGLTRAE